MDEEYKISIPLAVLNANFGRAGYFERVSFHAQECESYREAWERTEAELEAHGLPVRYSSYESFRNNRTRYLNNILGQKALNCQEKEP